MNVQKAAVVGYPIAHTMSPFIHRRLFSLSGIPCEYVVCKVHSLAQDWKALCGFDVFNVTIPHKTQILSLLDEVDEKAAMFGSVNTVQMKNGRSKGYTTDGYGFYKALESQGSSLQGDVLLLGNGGAARAVAFEILLSKSVDSLTIVCREASMEKGEALKGQLIALAREKGIAVNIYVLSYAQAEEQAQRYDLLVNTTSVGMHPNREESPVTEALVKRCGTVFEAIYNPRDTLLLQYAGKNGILAVGGMEMLVYQAVAAHEIWYGSVFEAGEIAALCADATVEMQRLFEEV